ncbi:MAG TPA: ATPase [Thermodesulfobacteriota bacterium]|nr:ATPase [Thermodesulfobacteriota bacterium]
MEDRIGQRLVKDGVITERQLLEAIERQMHQGGRLGQNLVELGHLSAENLDAFFRKHPPAPGTLKDTGLELSFITDLVLKHALFRGEFTLPELSSSVKLPVSIVDMAVETLRRDKLVEVKGATQYAKVTYKFNITGQGKLRAGELFDICRYVGPAPVSLTDYTEMVTSQTIKHIVVSEPSVKKGFSHLIISEEMLRRLGPAISSGKAIFLYGPPGNGKTAIAETMGNTLPGTVYMPYSIIVGGQIINVFDPVNHILVAPEKKEDEIDQRWALIKRPVVMTGGELTLKMLDLEYNPATKFYNAPLQMKANNGLFIVDDFGRQQITPQNLLNRWIVPLERRVDFLSLPTGMKFDIPFDQLSVFSTNIEPRKLVDEAFLRRIRYKIKIDHPTEAEYETIFKLVCRTNGIEFDEAVFDHLMKDYYGKHGVSLNACHPRDIVEHIIDHAHYYHHDLRLSKENIAAAWENYFVEM